MTPLDEADRPPVLEPLRDKVVGITGGSGFVGSAVVRRLSAHNEVRVLDLGLHGDAEPPPAGVSVVEGDVRDASAVTRLLQGCDLAIHLASIAGVSAVMSQPVATMDTAIIGTRTVLDVAANTSGIEKVVIFSTSEVAGKFAYNVQEETTFTGAHPGELRWTYAAAKLASEFYAKAFSTETGMPAVCLRPFNIYGPGQLGVGAVRQFVLAAVRNEPLRVSNDGAQIRAWCYIDDIVDAVDLALSTSAADGEVLNVGNPRSVITIRELARLVIRLAESASAIEYVKTPEVDVQIRIPDITRARSLLRFEPKVELDEGLERTIAWYRARLVE